MPVETLDFAGSFVSLAIDLPEAAWKGITKGDLIQLDTQVSAETPMTIFARINVRHGPNTDEIVRGIDLSQQQCSVAFDLFYSAIEPDRVSGMWLDFICEKPVMSRVVIHELALSRRPRANV